jgi:chemosensory pili system protein ChpB (putative protein-glutamate methylesterase)
VPDKNPNVGLMLTGAFRDALLVALSQAGYEVHIAATVERARTLLARHTVDAWIFDARDEDALELLLACDTFLLPADNIPEVPAAPALRIWVESLMTQLDAALNGGARDNARAISRWQEVRGVWLLAGSAGATSAIQAFLNTFMQPPPVAFIYAQHLDPSQQRQLQRFTVENPLFSLHSSETAQALQPSKLVMVSPRRSLVVSEFGQLNSTRSAWEGEYTPDINELLVILSAVKLPSPGVIIFSGMGSDGAAALPVFAAAGGRVWAQSPGSAICPAMPQAAIDSGFVQRTGEPEALARAIEALYSPL